MPYEIMTDVPPPRRRSASDYPFASMAVGECVDIPFADLPRAMSNIQYSRSQDLAAGLPAKKFCRRRNKETNTYRVWRLE